MDATSELTTRDTNDQTPCHVVVAAVDADLDPDHGVDDLAHDPHADDEAELDLVLDPLAADPDRQNDHDLAQHADRDPAADPVADPQPTESLDLDPDPARSRDHALDLDQTDRLTDAIHSQVDETLLCQFRKSFFSFCDQCTRTHVKPVCVYHRL